MKTNNILTLLLISTLTFGTWAQEKTNNKFYFSGGSFSTGKDYTRTSPFNQVKIQPVDYYSNLSPYSNYPYRFRSPSRTFMLNLEFEKRKSEQLVHRMRIGAGVRLNDATGGFGRRFINEEFDTVTNSAGNQIVIDSTNYLYTTHYTAQHRAQIDFSYLIQFQDKQRLSYYIGVGGTFGVPIMTRQYLNESFYKEDRFISSTSTLDTKNKFDFNSLVYIPIGLNFNLNAKTTSNLKYVLFAESKFGVQYASSAKLGSQFKLYNSINLGIRIKLNR